MGPTEWVAVAGLVSTLAAAALGAGITVLVQRQAHKHEDKTRFHDRRLEIYAEFNRAANATILGFLNTGVPDPVQGALGIRQFELLRLVASEPVLVAAARINEALLEASLGKATSGEFIPRFSTRMFELVTAMRQEINSP